MKKKWRVTLQWDGSEEIEVEASNESAAIEKAKNQMDYFQISTISADALRIE